MNEPSSLTTNDTMPPLLPFQKSASGNRRNEIADDAGSTKPDDDGSERMDGTLRRTFETKVSLEDGSSVADSKQIEVAVTEETVARVESHPMGLLDKYLKHQILTPSTAKPDIDLSGHTSCPTITSHVSEDFVERPAASPPRSHHQHDVATRLLGPNSGNNDIAAAACYLVYEPDSSGRLVEHYSMTSAEGAVGRWEAGGDKKIAQFKVTRNAGRNVLIGSCSAGVQGRRNYCNGWCQFVKSAKVMKGDVQLWDPTGKGMMVDVYLYYDDKRASHQTIRLEQGVAYSTDKLLAVACIPKNTTFFEGMAIDLLKWLSDARDHGYSTEI